MSHPQPDRFPSLDKVNLRPSERVLQYLLAEFDRPELKEGSRLPSNRELARRLKVSVPTVQGVLRQLAKEGRIVARSGSGTYLVSQPKVEAEGPIRIAVAAPLDTSVLENSDPWLNSIFGGLMPAVLRSRRPITLVGIAPEEFGTDISIPHMLDQVPHCHGLILIPYAFMPAERDIIVEAFEKAGKPVVYLHPFEMTATANFASSDHYTVALRAGQAFRAGGRRHIAMIAGPMEYSVALRWQHAGLIAGLGREIGTDISLRIPDAVREGKPQSAYSAVKKLLSDGNPLPDALYLPSGEELIGAVKALKEAGLSVPRDVSLFVGRDPMVFLPEFSGVTHGVQPLRQIGSALLEMVCQRIEQNGAAIPGRVFPCTIAGGSTTTEKENAVLFG